MEARTTAACLKGCYRKGLGMRFVAIEDNLPIGNHNAVIDAVGPSPQTHEHQTVFFEIGADALHQTFHGTTLRAQTQPFQPDGSGSEPHSEQGAIYDFEQRKCPLHPVLNMPVKLARELLVNHAGQC